MNTKKYNTGFRLTLAAFALLPLSSHAAVTYGVGFAGTASEVFSTTNEFAYQSDVSSTDLINGLASNPAATGWNTGSSASPVRLNDGVHGGNYTVLGNKTEGAWSSATGGSTVTYVLNTVANPLGFNITGIQSIAAWQGGGLGNQDYTISVKRVGSTVFEDAIFVEYEPISKVSPAGLGATKVSVTNFNAIGVAEIRFTSDVVNSNSGTVYRELDVFGTPTTNVIPEPSTALLAFGGLAFLLRRRRK